MTDKSNSSDQQKGGGRLTKFTRDVLWAALVDLASKALQAVGFAIGCVLLSIALFVLSLLLSSGSIPAWTLAVTIFIAVAVTALLTIGLVWTRRKNRALVGQIEELEPQAGRVEEVEDERERLEAELELRETYGGHIGHILNHFQKVLSGAIEGVSVTDFIERGILQPARDLLAERMGNPRLSVLRPQADVLKMAWAAGHDLESKQKYTLALKDSLARICFEEGSVASWDDVTTDPRFKPHPRARRPFRSMVAYPIRIGDEVKAVLNVISDDVAAFGPAEINYLTALGSVVTLAVGVAVRDRHSRGGNDKSVV